MEENSLHKCIICGSEVSEFLPYNYLASDETAQKQLAVFREKYQEIGSDLKNFSCPVCSAHDRERHLRLFFERLNLLQQITENTALLHIAPETHLKNFFASFNSFYITGDLFPANYNYTVAKLDLTNLPFKDNWFDFVLANHVLEHIPDDTKAMRELARVLKHGGHAILQTPFSPLLTYTEEDHSITEPSERLIRYGQHDHVRVYGLDFFNRLKDAGFKLDLKISQEIFTAEEARYYGFNNKEDLILCSK